MISGCLPDALVLILNIKIKYTTFLSGDYGICIIDFSL